MAIGKIDRKPDAESTGFQRVTTKKRDTSRDPELIRQLKDLQQASGVLDALRNGKYRDRKCFMRGDGPDKPQHSDTHHTDRTGGPHDNHSNHTDSNHENHSDHSDKPRKF